MRITISIFFILLLAAGSVGAENPEEESLGKLLSRQSYYQCADFTYNAILLIPKLYEAGKIDSIYLIIDFVEQKCDKTFRWTSTRMLLNMEEGKFTEDVYDSSIVYDLIPYRNSLESRQEHGEKQSWYYSRQDYEAGSAYEIFFDDLAAKIYLKYPTGTLEHLWAAFFRGDFTYFFRELKSPRYAKTKLQRYYLEAKSRVMDAYLGHGTNNAGLVGLWLPLGNSDILGSKPEIGYMYGNKLGKVQADMTFIARFLQSKNEYSYVDDGTLYTTDHFLGLYLGIDMGYELYTAGKHQFELLGGIGYDAIQARTKEDDEDGYSIESLNLNVGFRHKLFLSKYHDWYLGIQGRYNVVKYGTGGGTDLSGNTISLQLIVGRISSGGLKYYAERLGFFD